MTKPAEELYDLQADRDEVNNLADSAEHQAVLTELKQAQHKKILAIRDLGFLPEAEFHSLADGGAPYLVGQNKELYPLKQILKMADLASSGKPSGVGQLIKGLSSQNAAIRYWAAMGLLMRGEPAVAQAHESLQKALEDNSKSVRCIAAEALGKYGTQQDVDNAVDTLISLSDQKKVGVYVAMLALNGLDKLGSEKVARVQDQIAKLPLKNTQLDRRLQSYVGRLVERLQEQQAQAAE